MTNLISLIRQNPIWAIAGVGLFSTLLIVGALISAAPPPSPAAPTPTAAPLPMPTIDWSTVPPLDGIVTFAITTDSTLPGPDDYQPYDPIPVHPGDQPLPPTGRIDYD